MREENYLFRVGPLMFILNNNYSKIGYTYPVLFISWPDESYSCIDLTNGDVRNCNKQIWSLRFQNFQILNDEESIVKVFKTINVDWPKFEEIIFEMYEKALGTKE